MWSVYILVTTDHKYSYCGATNDFNKRFRQHCGDIAGGARFTNNVVKSGHSWRPLVVITGFENQRAALQMELCQKQKMDRYRHTHLPPAAKAAIKLISDFKHRRIKILTQTLWLEKWTSNAIPSDLVNLRIYWYDLQDMPVEWKARLPIHIKDHCSYDWSVFNTK